MDATTMVRSKIGSKTFVTMLEDPSAGGPVPTTKSPGSTAAAYKLIEATARKYSTNGATENGAGGPTGIFPFLDNAVSRRALEGVAASRLQGVSSLLLSVELCHAFMSASNYGFKSHD